MIDIRDRDAVVARLRDAQRRFEKGGPVPHASGQLLGELADALAESGPLEMNVPSSSWLSAVRTAERGVANTDAEPSSKTVRRAKRSLRELELFFSGKDTWRGKLVLPGAIAILVVIPALIVVGSHDKLRAVLWTAGVIAALCVLGFLWDRYEPDVKRAATWLDLPDRQLFAHPVKASTSDVKSFARAKLGAYVRPVLVATDRRLVLARPVNEIPGQSDSSEFELAWQLLYSDITSFSSKSAGGESPDEIVTVRSPERQVSYKLDPADGKALVAVLKRRAPEAFSESAAPAPAANTAPATGDTAGNYAQPVDTPTPRPRPPKVALVVRPADRPGSLGPSAGRHQSREPRMAVDWQHVLPGRTRRLGALTVHPRAPHGERHFRTAPARQLDRGMRHNVGPARRICRRDARARERAYRHELTSDPA